MSTLVPISVVLPVYNGERFLAEALDSILAQTFGDFELITVNDGSTDGSLAILQTYATRDPRLRIITRPNTGVARSRNEGLAAAQGELIAWMDADDVARPERFRRQYQFLQKNGSIGAVGAAFQAVDETGACIGAPKIFPSKPGVIHKDLQRGSCVMAQTLVMARREALRRVGGYRGLFTPAEDYDFWLRLSEVAELANLPDVLQLYRIHSQSLSMKYAFAQALGTEVARRAGNIRRRTGIDPVRGEESVTPELQARVGMSAEEVDLLRGNTLRCMASNHLLRGNLSAARVSIAEYEGASIAPWVRQRLAPEFELLQARIRKMQGNRMAMVSGTARICLRHPMFLFELIAKLLRRLRR
ncbi:MAG: glycosyltransferase family 2 protein [Kiritimatiellia bacterium]